jgi:hypothetical protein
LPCCFSVFFGVIVAFTAAAMWLMSSFSLSTSEKRHHPRPPIDQTVTAEDIAHLHLQVAKEASAAKDDVPPVKHHKPKVFARRRDNYAYGNSWGYTEAYRNDSRGFFIH